MTPRGIETPSIELVPILPELILVGVAIILLLADAVRPSTDRTPLFALSLLAVVVAAGFAMAGWDQAQGPDGRIVPSRLTALGGMVAADAFGAFFRVLILASAALAMLFTHHYFRRAADERGELYPLLLFATSGMTLISVAADLIVVFLALEILSLSLYVLVGMARSRLEAQEAGLKYFLLGAFSSAFFLYGIAFLYGASGTTSLGGVAEALTGEGGRTAALGLIGAGLLTVGFAFKVAAVPFHMWTPDVYQGAATPITAFMSAGTKVAGFAALLRVATIALGPVSWDVRPALWWISALTMVVGSVLAIAQRDVKRMLAYSSIAHAGFILVGVVAANQQGVSGAMFYLAAYAAMILGSFGVVMVVSGRREDRTGLEAFRGLGRRSPVLAAVLSLFLLSLAGIPPTGGFMAKVFVFGAGIEAGQSALVIVAVLASVVAAFFYLRVIVLMYLEEPTEQGRPERAAMPALGLGLTAIATVVLGVAPGVLLGVLRTAAVLRW
ncbi:MAG TPA: NADH-quinone oxidoreductase subunit NuoN [Actinomycetota bacterium]|nr:NADH-quinone oxidoreductase subunit NuoN [Actinomycetota bacterium]